MKLDSESGSVSVNHVLNARTQTGVSYFVDRSLYPQYSLTFLSQGANVFVARAWSARLSSRFSAGPVYTSTPGEPASSSVNYSATLAYRRGLTNYSVDGSQSQRSGLGVTTESRVQTVGASVSRKLSRFSSASIKSSYNRTTTLPSLIAPSGTLSTVGLSSQFSHSISRVLSGFGSYTLLRQTSASNPLAINALQGVSQSVGFGLTYTPRQIALGRQ